MYYSQCINWDFVDITQYKSTYRIYKHILSMQKGKFFTKIYENLQFYLKTKYFKFL